MAAVETHIEQLADAPLVPSLTWWRLLWAAIGAAIVWRVVEQACGSGCAKD
ncbi:hypothetical protein BDZ89DRAFT_1074761 [Hymenopellis radicata]|nr:hypothetical protein BDZ89DRAFT_1074761 [Hymenopellis radicata]